MPPDPHRRIAELERRLAELQEEHRLDRLELEQTQGALWQLSLLFQNAAIPILIADPSGCITDLNSEAERKWGRARKDLLGRPLAAIVPADRHAELQHMLAACRRGETARDVEGRLWGRPRDVRSSWMTLSPLLDQRGDVAGVVLAEDPRELKETGNLLEDLNEDLQSLALVDGLTLLGNRRHFERVLPEEVARAGRRREPLSLAMIDVDEFKAYNDALGHPAGDACLRQVGRRIARALHRPADLLARYGGEEFAVLLPDTDARGAASVAETIRARIETARIPHPRSRVGPVLTASVGVATARITPGFRPDRLLEAADRALYAAKEAGRNRVHAVELDGEAAAGAS